MGLKRLSEFEGEKAVIASAAILDIFLKLSSKENMKSGGETKGEALFDTFTRYMQKSPKDWLRLYAILSDEDPETYTCNGREAFANLYQLITDSELTDLFTYAGQRTALKSSGGATGGTTRKKG